MRSDSGASRFILAEFLDFTPNSPAAILLRFLAELDYGVRASSPDQKISVSPLHLINLLMLFAIVEKNTKTLIIIYQRLTELAEEIKLNVPFTQANFWDTIENILHTGNFENYFNSATTQLTIYLPSRHINRESFSDSIKDRYPALASCIQKTTAIEFKPSEDGGLNLESKITFNPEWSQPLETQHSAFIVDSQNTVLCMIDPDGHAKIVRPNIDDIKELSDQGLSGVEIIIPTHWNGQTHIRLPANTVPVQCYERVLNKKPIANMFKDTRLYMPKNKHVTACNISEITTTQACFDNKGADVKQSSIVYISRSTPISSEPIIIHIPYPSVSIGGVGFPLKTKQPSDQTHDVSNPPKEEGILCVILHTKRNEEQREPLTFITPSGLAAGSALLALTHGDHWKTIAQAYNLACPPTQLTPEYKLSRKISACLGLPKNYSQTRFPYGLFLIRLMLWSAKINEIFIQRLTAQNLPNMLNYTVTITPEGANFTLQAENQKDMESIFASLQNAKGIDKLEKKRLPDKTIISFACSTETILDSTTCLNEKKATPGNEIHCIKGLEETPLGRILDLPAGFTLTANYHEIMAFFDKIRGVISSQNPSLGVRHIIEALDKIAETSFLSTGTLTSTALGAVYHSSQTLKNLFPNKSQSPTTAIAAFYCSVILQLCMGIQKIRWVDIFLAGLNEALHTPLELEPYFPDSPLEKNKLYVHINTLICTIFASINGETVKITSFTLESNEDRQPFDDTLTVLSKCKNDILQKIIVSYAKEKNPSCTYEDFLNILLGPKRPFTELIERVMQWRQQHKSLGTGLLDESFFSDISRATSPWNPGSIEKKSVEIAQLIAAFEAYHGETIRCLTPGFPPIPTTHTSNNYVIFLKALLQLCQNTTSLEALEAFIKDPQLAAVKQQMAPPCVLQPSPQPGKSMLLFSVHPSSSSAKTVVTIEPALPPEENLTTLTDDLDSASACALFK